MYRSLKTQAPANFKSAGLATSQIRNAEGKLTQTVDASGEVSTYPRYYEDTADCRQRVYEQKDSKGRVTYKEVTELDTSNKPLREDTYNRKGKHVSSKVYSYTYY